MLRRSRFSPLIARLAYSPLHHRELHSVHDFTAALAARTDSVDSNHVCRVTLTLSILRPLFTLVVRVNARWFDPSRRVKDILMDPLCRRVLRAFERRTRCVH